MSNVWTLSNHLIDHLSKERLGDTRLPSLWPSEASCEITTEHNETKIVGACRRSTLFRYAMSNYQYADDLRWEPLVKELTKLEVSVEPAMRWIWEAGNLFEDQVIELAKQSGVYLASQIQLVIKEYGIIGKLDLLVSDPTTGGYIAQEIKSVHGYGANEVLGTPGGRNKGKMGSPRDSNLMQAAIYDWHLKKRMPNLQSTRLFYGARDTGRFAEYEITTELDSPGVTRVLYKGIAPIVTEKTVSPITIDGILASYQYIQNHYEAGQVPPRDYDLQYSDQRIQKLYERDELSKTDRETYEKIAARKLENIKLQEQGLPLKKELKALEKGDYQCGFCQWRRFCYDESGKPRAA